MTDRICDTCQHYNNPESKYECQYWGDCCSENTCSEWREGFHTHNLLFRIVRLENALCYGEKHEN
jgi:hypothetical protein